MLQLGDLDAVARCALDFFTRIHTNFTRTHTNFSKLHVESVKVSTCT